MLHFLFLTTFLAFSLTDLPFNNVAITFIFVIVLFHLALSISMCQSPNLLDDLKNCPSFWWELQQFTRQVLLKLEENVIPFRSRIIDYKVEIKTDREVLKIRVGKPLPFMTSQFCSVGEKWKLRLTMQRTRKVHEFIISFKLSYF